MASLKSGIRYKKLGASLALGLGLLFNAAAKGEVMPDFLVPQGTVPDYVQDLYQVHRSFAKGEVEQNLSELRIYLSIHPRITLPKDSLLQELTILPPDLAEEIARRCGMSLCAERFAGMTEPEQTIAKIVVMEALFHNGLTPDEMDTYKNFLVAYKPSTAYQAWEDAGIEKAARAIADSAEYTAIKKDLRRIAEITPETAPQQYKLRTDFMQMSAREIRRAFGRESVPMFLDIFPDDLNIKGIAAPRGMLKGHEEPFFVANYLPQIMDTPDDILKLAAHETKHVIDADMLDEIQQPGHSKDPGNPLTAHLEMIRLNYAYVFMPCKIDKKEGAGYQPQDDVCPDMMKIHRGQPRESSAYHFQDKVLEAVKRLGRPEIH